jgi:uncharacterized protein YdeI (YjbR/CyaY-like superfamily)
MKTDPRIDAYIAKATPAVRPILERLRAAVHEALPGLEETIKWGMPHFTLGGRNVAGMGGFKAHAALGIHGQGISEGKGSYRKIAAIEEIPSREELAAALQAAAASAGKTRRQPAAKPELAVPDDLVAALSPDARAFFASLAPSYRSEYLEWITGAKRAETRARRVAQAAEWLGEGKRLNWKYER